MKKINQTALLNFLGIVGVIAGITTLVVFGILNPAAFALAAIACYPMAKLLWQYAGYMHRNSIRILRKALPKAGFSIENTEWNDDHTAVRFHGKYQGDNFMIDAANDCAYVMICDMPWQGVKSSDPIMPKLMEAVNEVNSATPNISVIVCEPNNEGIRQIYTLSKTILPTFRPEQYLDSLMCDMLNRKPAIVDALNKERPYMAQCRGPVGFKVGTQPCEASEEESVAPAAKNGCDIKN